MLMMMVVNSGKERGSSVHHALDQARLAGQKCPCFGHLPEFGMIFVFLRFLVYQNTALFSTFRSSERPFVTNVTSQLFSIICGLDHETHI